jgi:hypothetical protein
MQLASSGLSPTSLFLVSTPELRTNRTRLEKEIAQFFWLQAEGSQKLDSELPSLATIIDW